MSMEVEFPQEIIVNILCRLPVESILEFKCVCKAWEALIQDPLFLGTYTARQFYSVDDGGNGDGLESLGFCIMGRPKDIGTETTMVHYGEYSHDSKGDACFKVTKPIKSPHEWFNEDIACSWNLIGSSNGLICFSACFAGYEKYTYTIYIYNPMTKEYVDLGPETFAAPRGDRNDTGYRAMGFGYHPSTKEYKVIRINYKTRNSYGQVKVYTLGSKSGWRDKEDVPYVFTTLYNPGVLVNGALHWLTYDHKIVCFDLADEEFRNVSVPPSMVLSEHDLMVLPEHDLMVLPMHDFIGVLRERLFMRNLLGVLGGRLCVYVNNSAWILKEYMMDESWTKVFSRDNVNGSLKEEDVALRSCCGSFVSNFHGEKRKVYSYDSESGSISNVSNNTKWFNDYKKLDIVSYTKSFVSLKALGEKDVHYTWTEP